MLVMLFGILIDTSPVQSEKAPFPILVTLSGILIDVSPVQPQKTLHPMHVTLLGISMDFSQVQPAKAESQITFIPSFMISIPLSLFPLNSYNRLLI